ncbi:MAG: metallophosphoesterase [Planctomycetia bacterium]
MDRRHFLAGTGAFLGLLGLGQAAEIKEEKKTKGAKKEKKKRRRRQGMPTEEESKRPVLPFVPGSWSIVVLPDTQGYSLYYPGLLQVQTQWIVDNQKKNNIAYVMQNGDLVHTRTIPEWEAASRGFEVLDGKVPYAIVPGNHEYALRDRAKKRTTRINEYFPPSRFEKCPTFGGTMREGHIESNYHLFEAGGKKWMIIALEWGPSDAVVKWADDLLKKYSDRKAIILTHAYLYQDSTRYDWKKKGNKQKWSPYRDNIAGGVKDGEDLWQELVKKHPNIFLVVNGHVLGDGLGFQVSKGDHGNLVNEMLVNYQMQELNGGSWLRLLEFLPDGKTVQARSYSPLCDRYKTDPENQFTFTIE